MLKEFKEFALKGNVFDMAVGIIVGGAFTAIVNSLIGDLIMPILGLITGGINFSDLFIALDGRSMNHLLPHRKQAHRHLHTAALSRMSFHS